MIRPRPPHLQREITRHGKAVWYVRVGQGPRIRIRANFGTPEFDAEYRAALAGTPERKAAPSQSTLAWLLARYHETTAWSDLSPATRRQRDNIFKGVIETAGHELYAKITSPHILAGKERRASTPHQARNFLDAMRGLFRWAVKAELVKVDPTAGVSNPPRKGGEGFTPWSEEHMAAYEARWPIGTRQRVWLDVLAYTGLRRGDAVRLGRQHCRDGVATIKTEKSGFILEVSLPILPILQATLDAGPCGDLTFIVGENGRPLTKESFGNLFKDACKAAGIPAARTASARSQQPARPMLARPKRSSWRSSVGPIRRWPRTTRAPQTGSALPLRRWPNWQHLFPHLRIRCGRQGRKPNAFNAEIWKWCGREESNLHGLSPQRPQRCASTISATTARSSRGLPYRIWP
jgi:integrase